jgi:nitronate monooxygenase
MGVGISLAGLASAVALAGGIGVIASIGIGSRERDFQTNFLEANNRALRREIRKAKAATGGVVGVNVMMAATNHGEFFATAIDEKADIIFCGAGLPMTLPSYLNGSTHTKLVPIVSSGRAADLLCKRWLHKYDYLPDAIVVEGPRAGGHLGFSREQITDPAFSLELLVESVLVVADRYGSRAGREIPVIAGGGIYTGQDIRAFMDRGASGVQMGTRFVATHECDADPSFKQMYLDASAEDVVIIQSPVGMPGRAIRNRYLDDVESGMKKPYKCPYHCISTCDVANTPYCIAQALINAQKGKFDHGFAFAGANAYRVSELLSVQELMKQLEAGYAEGPAVTAEQTIHA